ncbi:FAD-dependent oxidoreductase [Marinovum sp. 2_MG-2023]|uniref:FAD-dependent oxidoreductase n=1 Tax=unclassified Marinovum TaxID=2647166 RepID=UPI0026E1CA9C|nr:MULTISPECIES: FAD-dependent oxidoreductase [unclassified Marinovum]MDO6728977.1 FAD-dependent oxidoreductase [Marinovum sp. 2_MG-2023]MDO6779396.1 FAD-dependent oxidoreductase [Marinovum sp. 1_MG-2023]
MTQPTDVRDVDRLDTDLVIVGGGAAGVATALTAARNGLRVVVVERHGFCGGGAVAGHSGTICGLYEASETHPNGPVQSVFGFADEFVKALEARGGLDRPVRYGKTFTRVHDPIVWRETADDLLAAAGVTVIYHAVATRVLTEGDRIEGVELWTKQGPLRVMARLTVDASGDADLVAMAGLPNFVGDNGRVQNPTMIFRLMGVDVAQFRAAYGDDTIMPPEVSDMIVAANTAGTYALPRAKIWLFTTTRPGELLCNCTRILGENGRELNPLFWRDFAEAETQGRRQAREYARFFRDTLAGCAESFVNDMAVQVGVRQTRQITGVARLSNADVVSGAKFAGGIARSPWPIELHAGARPRVEWLLNDVYEVPYSCFVPQRGEGLLAVGRCLSAEHEAVASARVTAQCFGYGHAIGHAATIAVRDGVAPRDIDGADLRILLNRDGAQLD